jgi:hypothetical protein
MDLGALRLLRCGVEFAMSLDSSGWNALLLGVFGNSNNRMLVRTG